MPISGLVITLSDTPKLAELALVMLRRDPRIELGQRRGPCQPAVIETDDTQEDCRLWEQLHEQEGIVKVDLVFVHFEEPSHLRADSPGSTIAMQFSEPEYANPPQGNTMEL